MSEQAETEWAYIFNTFGEETLRSMLFSTASDLQQDDTADRRVIEIQQGDDDYHAFDVTDHVGELEDDL